MKESHEPLVAGVNGGRRMLPRSLIRDTTWMKNALVRRPEECEGTARRLTSHTSVPDD